MHNLTMSSHNLPVKLFARGAISATGCAVYIDRNCNRNRNRNRNRKLDQA